VEEADVVFSLEQTCEKPKPKTKRLSEMMEEEEEDEDKEEEKEDSDMEESSTAELFLQMKENPEELLQLAPHSGDAIILINCACHPSSETRGKRL